MCASLLPCFPFSASHHSLPPKTELLSQGSVLPDSQEITFEAEISISVRTKDLPGCNLYDYRHAKPRQSANHTERRPTSAVGQFRRSCSGDRCLPSATRVAATVTSMSLSDKDMAAAISHGIRTYRVCQSRGVADEAKEAVGVEARPDEDDRYRSWKDAKDHSPQE